MGGSKVGQGIDIHDINRDVLQTLVPCRSGITRCHEHALCVRRLGGLPGQGVFTPAAANNQDVHIVISLVQRSVTEVAHTGEDHGNTMLIGCINHFLVPH